MISNFSASSSICEMHAQSSTPPRLVFRAVLAAVAAAKAWVRSTSIFLAAHWASVPTQRMEHSRSNSPAMYLVTSGTESASTAHLRSKPARVYAKTDWRTPSSVNFTKAKSGIMKSVLETKIWQKTEEFGKKIDKICTKLQSKTSQEGKM